MPKASSPLGGVGAMSFVLATGNPDNGLALPVMLAAGVVFGAAWAMIPAYLRTKLNTNELLTSLMLVYVAEKLVTFLVTGPFKGPQEIVRNWNETIPIADALRLPLMIEGTRFHIAIPVAVIIGLLLTFMLAYTLFGYRLKVAHGTPKAQRFAGFSETRTMWLTFLISGGLAGLAGALYVSANLGKLSEHIFQGFGFAAIAVAFLGRLHPIGILVAAFALGLPQCRRRRPVRRTPHRRQHGRPDLRDPAVLGPGHRVPDHPPTGVHAAASAPSKDPPCHPTGSRRRMTEILDLLGTGTFWWGLITAVVGLATPVAARRRGRSGHGEIRRPEPGGRGHDAGRGVGRLRHRLSSSRRPVHRPGRVFRAARCSLPGPRQPSGRPGGGRGGRCGAGHGVRRADPDFSGQPGGHRAGA